MGTRRFTQLDSVWPAGLGRRLGAMLYDGFLVTAIWIAVTVAHMVFFRYVLGQQPEEVGTTSGDIWSLRLMLVFFVTPVFRFLLDPGWDDTRHAGVAAAGANGGWLFAECKAVPYPLWRSVAIAVGVWFGLLVGAIRPRKAQLAGYCIEHANGGVAEK
ncbi:hypothetical protein HSBAA_08140 [Vreelandella sulfidaeris]|uniref:RDD domain-containing protein n=1 Tax=Vreelandella sulfidaeris TaxID=115553 RepID=A0A455U5C0_9GAMM|nr:hypothetical protein HSBAA_08140 [Halomonas sulfidaeris]